MRFTRCLTILLAIVFLLCYTAQAMTKEEAASEYNKAGDLYRDNSFGEALSLYETLIQSGINNPDLYYNASNAAYRDGQLGKAILYIERSLRLAPSDTDALANRDFLNSVKADQETSVDNAVLVFFINRYNRITTNDAALISAIMFAIALIFLTTALFFISWKRTTLISFSALFFFVSILMTVILVQKTHYISTVSEGIVMQEEVSAFSGPDDDNTHIFTIHEGTKIVIERTQDDWSLVRLRSGAGGWILTATIGVI